MQEDLDDFQKTLIEYPKIGDLIIGTGGVRKTRIKSSSSGKSGGFRICYYFLTKDDQLFLLLIYPKNVQDNLTVQQKKDLKELVTNLKAIK